MKEATLITGQPICAGADAPEQAFCPVCGRTVFLRNRQKMGEDERTYFWQHERGSANGCGPKRRVRRPVIVRGA